MNTCDASLILSGGWAFQNSPRDRGPSLSIYTGNESSPARPEMRKEIVVPRLHSTTILAVRHRGGVALGGDGQVTLGQHVVKSDAHKIRRLYNGRVLTGFAGASADAF